MSNDFSWLAINALKSNLSGLPSFCRLVMYELFPFCDYAAGKISIGTLDDLARTDFYVDSLRGREKEYIAGDAIRNAFRSIKKCKPDYFIFSTVNQRIVIEMPFIRELYESFHKAIPKLTLVLSTDVASATTQSQTDDQGDFEPLLAGEFDSNLAAASSTDGINAHVKNQNPTNNKQTNSGSDSFAELKQPIRRDFHPNAETIELALSHGYVNVTNPTEIKRFITYNLASLTRWADYNPVFLNWLERAHDNQKRAEPISTTHTARKNTDEQRTPNQVTGRRKPTIADAIADNLSIIEAIKRQEEQHRQQANDFINGEYCESLAVPY